MQSVSITTKVVCLNSVHGKVYSIQYYVIKFVIDLQWFSLGSLVSSTNITDSHDITEILLKVALSTSNQAKTLRKPLLIPLQKGNCDIKCFPHLCICPSCILCPFNNLSLLLCNSFRVFAQCLLLQYTDQLETKDYKIGVCCFSIKHD